MRGLAAIVLLLLAIEGQAAERVVSVSIDGVVHPITVDIVSHAIEQAKAEQAALLLIRLDTPGGLMTATRQMGELLLASPMPVVTYVAPGGARAASAGFFILQAGDIAAMAPGTNTGAAAPVMLGGEMDKVMREKVQNDAAAFLRSVAAKRGRNAAAAEKTVLESKSYTEQEALESNLIELIAADQAELFRRLDGRQVKRLDGSTGTLRLASPEVVEYDKSLREEILSAISDPNLALILLVLGALGVYVEFTSPGLIAPGVIGGILVLLGLSALSVLPINWLGAALLALALTLFVLEAMFTSHGILGAGGAAAMILGALLLIDSPMPEMRIRLGTAIGVALPFAIITTFLITLVVRARAAKVATGTAGMVDEIGTAMSPLAPDGKVFLHGEYWDAVSSAPVEPGRQVRVTAVKDLTLRVEPLQPDESNAGRG